ncbi:unnamed protein product [Schistosoma mattheei]|uniref:Uncharacterized protein n=1 Tax=Schistosoma mattheei TaxID=31246 RepID=A0A183NQ68_9TREM|nr:unnamed protein product [Schistosoma mattheei]
MLPPRCCRLHDPVDHQEKDKGYSSSQSVGTCSSSQILPKGMLSIFAVTAASAFSASAGMLSGPSVSPLLIYLVAMLISSIVGESTLIGRSVVAA